VQATHRALLQGVGWGGVQLADCELQVAVKQDVQIKGFGHPTRNSAVRAPCCLQWSWIGGRAQREVSGAPVRGFAANSANAWSCTSRVARGGRIARRGVLASIVTLEVPSTSALWTGVALANAASERVMAAGLQIRLPRPTI